MAQTVDESFLAERDQVYGQLRRHGLVYCSYDLCDRHSIESTDHWPADSTDRWAAECTDH